MLKLIDVQELTALTAADAIADRFGPGTCSPAIVVTLEGCADMAALKLLPEDAPCPIIGIGREDHPLASVCDVILNDAGELPALWANVVRAPLAAMVLVQQLRLSERLDVRSALVAESLAFATLQRGPEFAAWFQARAIVAAAPVSGAPIRHWWERDAFCLELSRPETRNAIDTEMRDALAEMLDVALADEDRRPVRLTGGGKCFSTGGALWQFGEASDAATAHWIRTVRSIAARLARLAPRLTVRVQGAAIGAGVEMAAFASRLIAAPDAWFQLPELRYGLIPGAGGTVSLARRIGRRRVAYMALSMRRISAKVALRWGLIDAVER